MTLGWGIIGLGRIAGTALAPAIRNDSGSRLIAVCGRDLERASVFAQRHGAERVHTDFGSMLTDDRVDAVMVATPNAFHFDQVAAAAAAGKHVLCEKPLAVDVAQSRAAVAACRSAGVALGIDFESRYFPAMTETRAQVKAGRLGEVRIVEFTAGAGDRPFTSWRADRSLAGSGTIANVAVHAFDALRFMLDSEPIAVAATWDAAEGSLERSVQVLLRFANGARAYVSANESVTGQQQDMRIYGTLGRIFGSNVTRPWLEGAITIEIADHRESHGVSNRAAYDDLVRSFRISVEQRTEPRPSGIDGLRAAQVSAAVARAASEGREIAIPAGPDED